MLSVYLSVTRIQYLKGAYKQEGSQLFERVGNSRTRENGFNLKEVMNAPSLEVLKARLDGSLGSLVQY